MFPAAPRPITWLDVYCWRAHLALTGETLHVYLDGVDVTQNSFRAVFHEDGRHGNVWRYKRNADGQVYCAPGTLCPAVEVLTGLLALVPGEPFR
jgi:hypothetical protein